MRTVIDISYLIHWNGRMTGIPRVINEIASRYNSDGDVTFVVWDGRSEQFYVTDLNTALKTRGVSIYYLPKQSGFFLLLDKVIRYLGFGVVAMILSKIGRRLKLELFESIANVLIRFRFITKQKFISSPNDIFVITMGDWKSEIYINTIKKYHKGHSKIVQFCYDMLPVVTPQYSGHSTKPMAAYNKAIFPISDMILAISEHTKKDIINWLGQNKLNIPKIEVFRLGDDFDVVRSTKLSNRLHDQLKVEGKDYILCVGTIESRKNHALLYYAYKLALSRNEQVPKLVVVGRNGWRGDNVYDLMLKDPEVNGIIKVVKDASDQELAWLYDNAMFSVYPSFYEGWGLPIAESIAHGIPCIASNTSSMPEIAGDLIQYFNPVSPEDCLEKIIYMSDKKNLDAATKKISAYKPTLWKDTYDQVNKYIKELYV